MIHNVVISPFSRPLRNGGRNAKDYPWWHQVVTALRHADLHVTQVGVAGEPDVGANGRLVNAPLKDVAALAREAAWASVDNFFPHFANLHVRRPGVVVYGPSDPDLFGYRYNVNLLKDRRHLRPDPWRWWEDVPYDDARFLPPHDVAHAILNLARR